MNKTREKEMHGNYNIIISGLESKLADSI